MTRTHVLLALLVALFAGGLYWATRPATLPTFSLAAEAQEVTQEQLAMVPDMVLGAEDAPVTVIEYASYTCPHCATFHAQVLPQIKADYIDTGKVRYVYREVYFDRYGLWAAMVARCTATTERYFAMADVLYDEQKAWLGDGQPGTVANNLRRLGLAAGLDKDQLEACLNDTAMAQAMVAAYQKNATADGVNSTPSLVIGGALYSNRPYDEIRAIIDEELAE
jgi:protein-disulfide isomerase